MRRRFRVSVAIAAVTFVASSVSFAHHSVVGQFNPDEPLELTGVISKIDWVNPHIYVHLDVEDDAGGTVSWQLETVPPAFLYRAQITPDMLGGGGKPVTIEAIRGRDKDQNLGFIIKIHYAEGHTYQLSADRE
jgi:hypothetical protein